MIYFPLQTVQQGKRYRFRLIQIACRPFFTFSIDQHNLTVIELDGTEHDPVTFQNVDIYVGEYLFFIDTRFFSSNQYF